MKKNTLYVGPRNERISAIFSIRAMLGKAVECIKLSVESQSSVKESNGISSESNTEEISTAPELLVRQLLTVQ
jgi:hypothetical protein